MSIDAEAKLDLSTLKNHALVLRKHIDLGQGEPTKENLPVEEQKVREPADGEVLVRVHYISVDPANRIYLAPHDSYLPMVQVGQVLPTLGTGQVIASKHPNFKVGQAVSGALGGQQYVTVKPELAYIQPVPAIKDETDMIELLGINGLTAYFGVTDVLAAKKGEVAVVDGASGSVGSAAGQILKALGCHVIGITGSDEKCAQLVKEFGFDAAINYAKYPDVDALAAAIKEKAPKGVDCFFCNAGGKILDAVLDNMNKFGRIALCGLIAVYNEKDPGLKNLKWVVFNSLTVRGFLFLDFVAKFGTAIPQLMQWRAEGKIATRPKQIIKGLGHYVEALNSLMASTAKGKPIIDARE